MSGLDASLPGPSARFAELVAGPEDRLALDEAALLIAAHAHPGLDVAGELELLDELAASCPEPTIEGWRRYVFVDLGFSGNSGSYHDPANSYLDDVVRRRMGLPITLSVVGMELARRLGIDLVGVGMPGHFLVRTPPEAPEAFFDPFDGGRVIDRAGCRERFETVNRSIRGRTPEWSDAYLEPVGPRAILARMLANLKSTFARSGDLASLEWVLSLRLAIPGVPVTERRDRARVQGANGRFLEAAGELEDLASALPDLADALEREAVAFRARLN